MNFTEISTRFLICTKVYWGTGVLATSSTCARHARDDATMKDDRIASRTHHMPVSSVSDEHSLTRTMWPKREQGISGPHVIF